MRFPVALCDVNSVYSRPTVAIELKVQALLFSPSISLINLFLLSNRKIQATLDSLLFVYYLYPN